MPLQYVPIPAPFWKSRGPSWSKVVCHLPQDRGELYEKGPPYWMWPPLWNGHKNMHWSTGRSCKFSISTSSKPLTAGCRTVVRRPRPVTVIGASSSITCIGTCGQGASTNNNSCSARGGGGKNGKKGGARGVACCGLPVLVFMFISNLCSPLFVLKRVFLGSLFIVFVKVIIWVNCRLVHCWAGGRHFFHLKELTLLVVVMSGV